MKFSTHIVRAAATLTLAAVIAACASTGPAAPSNAQVESLLVAAGFRPVVASTDKQLQQVPTLPPGQVTVITDTGKNWYVYPDLPKNRVYVGTRQEYQKYLSLRAQSGIPAPDPYAGYNRQDAAMIKADKQDASLPPWAWEAWPQFGDLVFQ